ncbi:MAG: hypothetical protein JWO87_853 [Phycisphaerales bacterium]|jgi:hypothetical protein|nr:hypothetical protein [Phycisphaerales bacterium]
MCINIRTVLAAVTFAGVAGLAGCDVYESDEPRPVVYDSYYQNGWYEGPDYIWVDRDGHRFHERREEHERHEHAEHRGGFEGHGGGEGHEGHGGGGHR